MWAFLPMLLGAGLVVYLSGSYKRQPYECDPEEIIVHEWQGSVSGSHHTDIYIPMWRDFWGRFYYGEFCQSQVSGKLHQRRFTSGDDYIRYGKLMKRIERTSWVDKSIDREQAVVDRAKQIYEEATL